MKNTKDKTRDSRRKCKHIDDSERQIIEKLYRKGQSVAQYVTYSADRASDEAHLRASSHGPPLKSVMILLWSMSLIA